MSDYYRVSILVREPGTQHGVVSELKMVGTDDVLLLLRGFGHTNELVGTVRCAPGRNKTDVIKQYLAENHL